MGLLVARACLAAPGTALALLLDQPCQASADLGCFYFNLLSCYSDDSKPSETLLVTYTGYAHKEIHHHQRICNTSQRTRFHCSIHHRLDDDEAFQCDDGNPPGDR